MTTKEMMQKLNEEKQSNNYVHFAHVALREISVTGTFVSSRGIVHRDAGLTILKGARFCILCYESEHWLTGYVEIFDSLAYVRVESKNFVRVEKE